VSAASRFASACLPAIALAAASCGASIPDVDAKAPTLADAQGSPAQTAALCEKAENRDSPLVVEWPGTHKVELESISKRGLVVVKYEGCKLSVLPLCEAKGAYTFESISPQVEGLEIKDENDLFAKLPVAAPGLRAEMASGKAFKLDYVLVGQRIAADGPSDMTGDCAGATHFVRTISVGAYKMESMAKASQGADVDAGIVQAGGSRSSSRARNRASGDVGGCGSKTDLDESAARTAGCSAPVQLGLVKLP
jgi:hypothetical protein